MYKKEYIFSNEEFKILKEPRKIIKEYDDNEEWKKLEDNFFNILGFHNQKYHLSVDYCASNIIHNIMCNYGNQEDVLFITSSCEHDIVKSHFHLFPNHITLFKNNNDKQINNILRDLSKYKKVLIYHIGTGITNGEIFDNKLFLELKAKILLCNPLCEVTMVLDDVQGMFIVPRDYSIFDYVIGTAHSLTEYDMGMVISKNDDYGYKVKNWLNDYIPKVSIVKQHYNEIIDVYNYLLENLHCKMDLGFNKTENILAVDIPDYLHQKILNAKDELLKLKIHYDYNDDDTFSPHRFLRIRLSEFLTQKVKVDDVISFINGIME